MYLRHHQNQASAEGGKSEGKEAGLGEGKGRGGEEGDWKGNQMNSGGENWAPRDQKKN